MRGTGCIRGTTSRCGPVDAPCDRPGTRGADVLPAEKLARVVVMLRFRAVGVAAARGEKRPLGLERVGGCPLFGELPLADGGFLRPPEGRELGHRTVVRQDLPPAP